MRRMVRTLLAAFVFTLSSVTVVAQEQPPSEAAVPPQPTEVAVSTIESRSCPGCDLREVNLSGRDLSRANFAGADLTGADFRGSTLTDTIFIGATLTGARFDGANLTGADLSSARLEGAILESATLTNANLQHARLGGANLGSAKLQGALAGPDVSLTGEPLEAIGAADDALCGYADLTPITRRVYVSPSGTDSDSCGATVGSACKTIQKGFARCGGQITGCGVLVMYGEYQLPQTLKYEPGVSLYGGCVPRQRWKKEYFSTILAPPGGVPAIFSQGVMSHRSVMQGFTVIGSNATARGAASVAMVVRSSSRLELLNNTIVAGEGGAGLPGSDAQPGAAGGNGNGRTGGTSGCGSPSGGKGAGVMNVSVQTSGLRFTCNPSCPDNNCYGYAGEAGSTGRWQGGGKWGRGNCTECGSAAGDNGEDGASGHPAPCGPGGAVSPDNRGTFSDTTWAPSVSSGGTGGGVGGGGGGGGSGGYRGIFCFWVTTENSGNTGGGGGGGGCPSLPGGGGQQGGASFAIVTKITMLNMNDCRIIGARGGAGGRGGNGAKGGAGGTGAGGASGGNAGTGGRGGNGGPGGSSGGGAGGNGGPSVLIAMLQETILNVTGTTYYGGTSGLPGSSGIGGATADAGNCSGANGAQGINGVVADSRQY